MTGNSSYSTEYVHIRSLLMPTLFEETQKSFGMLCQKDVFFLKEMNVSSLLIFSTNVTV